MEAATAIETSSFMQGGRELHAPKKFMHSHSLHLPCRIQAPSPSANCRLNKCKDKRLTRDEWLSNAKMRRSKKECQSTLMDTSCYSNTTTFATATTSTTTTTTTTTTTPTYNDTENDSPKPTFTRRREHDEVGVQELTVYEVNEGDRSSPVLLPSSKLAVDWYNRLSIGDLGDLILFTNKLFDGSLKKRLGITAGMISLIRYYPKESEFLYESVYSFYFGDFGHISVKGPYKFRESTTLMVTGGSGIFNGVYGTVEIHNVEFPIVLFYTFKLYGIAQLPEELRWKTVPPAKGVRPSHNASSPGVALCNFTD